VLKKMGLEEAARARDTTELGTRILNRKGGVVVEIPKGEGGGGGLTAEYELLRADLCGLFMEATENRPSVEYRFGHYVTGLEQDDMKVDVTFHNGTKEAFDMVVAADGASSKIRSMILDKSSLEGSYNFTGMYTAFLSIPSLPTDTRHWYWFNEPNGLCLMTRPHRTGKTVGVYMVICTPAHGVRLPDVEAALEGGVEAQKGLLKRYFANSGWQARRILDQLDTSDDFYMSRSAQVKLPIWHANRTVLLGDAAFAAMGVGTSLAIESAYHLAGHLGKITSSAEVPAALDAYESEFRKVYKKSEDMPFGFPQIMFPQTAMGLKVRDVVAWTVGKTKVWKLLPDGDSEGSGKLAEYEWAEA
jgi:2-polyprenyl-6-methoxyphenol hydroxylase-like FAD-dependent oxidoreductase